MKVGLLTGGGDCPGLNAVIRGVVRSVHNFGGESIGFINGWKGILNGTTMPLTIENTDDIISKGGTILGSSRTNPYKEKERDVPKLLETYKKLGLDALVAIGGDDTLGVASKLYTDYKLNTVGCPKTIDNDLSCTDVTFGFDTAINIAMEAVERVRTTVESHRRIGVVETMGRNAGWIACEVAMAVGADYVLLPEIPVNIDELCTLLKNRREQGKQWGMVIVSEGAKLVGGTDVVTRDKSVDAFGHEQLGGVGRHVAELITQKTGIETREVVLGHIQRGGSPTAFDRVLGTRLGLGAGRLVKEKKFGRMVALAGTKIIDVALSDAVGQMKQVSEDWIEDAYAFSK